jgi:hypothetical protein
MWLPKGSNQGLFSGYLGVEGGALVFLPFFDTPIRLCSVFLASLGLPGCP